MKQRRKLPGILIYLLILFFSVVGFVYALNSKVLENYKQVTHQGEIVSSDDGVVVSKTIEETELENYFDITLNVKTTSKIEEVIDSNNLAIVFVIDRSYTMSYSNRWDKAVDAVVSLSTNLSNLPGIRMAAVGFSGGKKTSSGKTDVAWNDTKTIRSNFSSAPFTETELGSYDSTRSYTGGTNIEAGLYEAKKLLDTLPDSVHKKIILLSDGVPTFYYLDNGLTDGPGNSDEYNKMKDVPECQKQALTQAAINKAAGIDTYTVGYELNSLSHQFTVNGVVLNEKQIALDTLEQIASSSDQFYQADTSTIQTIFNSILEKIRIYKETVIDANWVANDPMGIEGTVNIIEFVGFKDDLNTLQNSLTKGQENQSDTATFNETNKSISWDLKNSSYTTTQQGELTYYNYSVTYRVRLKNEATNPLFNTTEEYLTNGVTSLKYVTKIDDYISDSQTIYYDIPKVVGYLGNFEFTKKSANFDEIVSKGLEGAEFTLTHHHNCDCLTKTTLTNGKHMSPIQSYKVESDSTGKVSFTNIPSGHKYLLTETKAPDNYNASETTKVITINYGIVENAPVDSDYYNKLQTGNLKITKEVQGNKDYAGEFEFELTVTHKTTTLTGKYDYKIFNSSNEEISSGGIILTDGTFKLKDGEYIVIYGLPIGSKYSVKELTTNGYTVKHKINTDNVLVGATATCSSTDCDINNGGTQTVNFYNIAGYILPATGSSGMLILVIIASLLIIGPIIDIGYMFYKNRKEDKLTS